MTGAAQTLVTISAERDADYFPFERFSVFTSVPEHHHDVAVLLGSVVVYETDGLCREGIEDGALYIVEDQRPVGGMSWETYDRLNCDYNHDRQPRIRIQTSRRVVRVVRCEARTDRWWQVLPSGYHDGPFADWSVACNMVGKVVGIYRPVDDGGQS